MHAASIYGYSSTIVPESTSEQTPVRTNFTTPEGVYKQTMTVNEYFRSNQMPNQVAGPVCNAPVRVSFLRISIKKINTAMEVLPSTSFSPNNATCCVEDYDFPNSKIHSTTSVGIDDDYIERICFNIGREIYVFDYSGVNGTSSADSTKPVDKRVYKGTFPTCHDFNKDGATLHSCLLLIGFSAGQIQMIDPSQKEAQNSSKLFNEERQIDRCAVTCLRWIPDGRSLFVASHASGYLYVYNEELDSPQVPPSYQVVKQGEDFTVSSCKSKVSRNPLYRWQIGTGAINKFEFSGPSSNFMATIGQDGHLRIFNWKRMELIGCMKSYFGGLLCLAWSPDLRYIATGGEDDMLSLYSVAENRVVCRGQGHKSWISDVAFDPFATFTSPSSAENYIESTTGYSTQTNEVVVATSTESMFIDSNASTSCKNTTTTCSNRKDMNTTKNTIPNNGNNNNHQLAQNGIVGNARRMASPAMEQSTLISSNSINNCLPHAISTNSNISTTRLFPIISGDCALMRNASTSDDCAELNPSQSRLVYRLGTVGHDCQLCLWDISEDLLLSTAATTPTLSRNSRMLTDAPSPADATSPISNFSADNNQLPHHSSKYATPMASAAMGANARNTTVIPIGIDNAITMPNPSSAHEKQSKGDTMESEKNGPIKNGNRFKRLHKRGFSLGSRLTDRSARQNGTSSNGTNSVDGGTLKRGDRISAQMFGTPQCPRIEETPVIEPLTCKKVANERLGSLHFREDCIVTACQEGYICTWARPNARNRQDGMQPNLSMSDCPNDCHHSRQLSIDNFASTCV